MKVLQNKQIRLNRIITDFEDVGNDYDDELESLRKDNLRLIKRISRLRGIILYNNIDLSDDDYEFVHNEVKINRLREKEIEIQIELIDNLRF